MYIVYLFNIIAYNSNTRRDSSKPQSSFKKKILKNKSTNKLNKSSIFKLFSHAYFYPQLYKKKYLNDEKYGF